MGGSAPTSAVYPVHDTMKSIFWRSLVQSNVFTRKWEIELRKFSRAGRESRKHQCDLISCGRLEFDEATFDLAVHGLANKPAFLGCSIVVEANARTAAIGGNHRVLERALSEPMEVATEDCLEIQLIAALK